MPKKRRNGGRGKKNKGLSKVVNCCNCGRVVGKDKAIKRFQARNMVDASSKRDIKENSAYAEEDFYMPRIYIKQEYCVSCAVHHRIVRVRSVTDRKVRTVTKRRRNPDELRKRYNKPKKAEE